MTKTVAYRGRFAPSPTGRLHFGSLVAALASYLDAKAHHGTWLVRMEDLDPPREEAGAGDSILRSLEAHSLFWDQAVLYQSSRLEAYEAALETLHDHIYYCGCTRQRVIDLGKRYDGFCRKQVTKPSATPCSIRVRMDHLEQPSLNDAENFKDLFLGPQSFPLNDVGDFIIRRKDGLFAYQLAVAVDDHFQEITHVVRGFDLIDSTSRQRYLLSLLNHPLPEYGHTPLALGADGDKLSKQTRAQAIINEQAFDNLCLALIFLGHRPPNDFPRSRCEDLLTWAIKNWKRSKVPKVSSIAPTLSSA
jgi:glutamyl-Q tRNA(Asp) synthetase